VRSNPRDRAFVRGARWVSGDVDGDGACFPCASRTLRASTWKTRPAGVMLRAGSRRRPTTSCAEGTIENFDGTHVPDPHFLSDNDVDLNRNFRIREARAGAVGAGPFGASEPESRAVIEWATRTRTSSLAQPAHLRRRVYPPLGNAPTQDEPERSPLYRQIGEWARNRRLSTVSGFEQFMLRAGKSRSTATSSTSPTSARRHRLRLRVMDLFARLGIERKKPFVDHYTHLTRENLLALAKLTDQNRAASSALEAFRHPQLGELELAARCNWSAQQPPYESSRNLRAPVRGVPARRALAPALEMDVRAAAGRVEIEVRNAGYLPTYILDSAKKLALDARVFVEIEPRSCSIDARDARLEVGHLEDGDAGLRGIHLRPAEPGQRLAAHGVAAVRGSGRCACAEGCASARC